MSHETSFSARIGDDHWSLSIAVHPTAEPISIAETKRHLRITSGDDDENIDELIQRARRHVEELTERTIPVTQYVLRLDRFPGTEGGRRRSAIDSDIRDDAIPLLKPPIVSIDSVDYTDADGNPQTMPAADYETDIWDEPGAIVPAIGVDWPDTVGGINDVSVTYTAGYDGVAHVLPPSLKHAMLMLVAHWHEHREAAIEARPPQGFEFAFDSLISQARVGAFA